MSFFAPNKNQSRALPQRKKIQQEKDPEKPLLGVKVCLDPGHIGGEFARLEERYFKIGEDPSVEEATLNLMTCRALEKLLIQKGGEVVWTKTKEEPVTSLRPEDLRNEALTWIFDLGVNRYLPIEAEITKRANILFYRTAEIKARAERVELLKPDLTLCIHYNAGPWGPDINHPKMLEKSKLVIFTTGAFMKDELVYDDQKFDLFFNLLEQQETVELGVSIKVAEAMKDSFKMEPEAYKNWSAVLPMKKSPYVYARNLAANRWFEGPTVFVEGPYMNAKDTYERLIAGDYEGHREIQGVKVPNIHQQFAEAICEGVVAYFQENHPSALPPPSSGISPQILWNP